MGWVSGGYACIVSFYQVTETVLLGSSSGRETGGEAGSQDADPSVDSNRQSSCESDDIKEQSDNNEEQCRTGDILDFDIKPNQPHPKNIAVQKLSNRVLHFQENWYKQYPWLHYSPTVKGILCFYCVKTYTRKKNTLSKKADPAFSSKGFSNWKNALVSFERHQNSKSHHHAVTVSAQEANPVDSQLSSAWAKQQDNARHCLKNIVSSVQYLARQGLALRGHATQDGNLFQLLKFKAKDDASLSSWLSRCHDYTSPPVQNEILQLLGNYCQKYCSLYPVSTSFAVLTHYRWHSRCLRSRARIYLF
ncbi:hypothetical protein PO909_029397 [Leuciscus waleckii]